MASGNGVWILTFCDTVQDLFFFPYHTILQCQCLNMNVLNSSHGAANIQGMFSLLSTLVALSNFTTYILGAATDRASQRDENHRPELEPDCSEALFSLYQDMTEEDDKQRAKRWQKDADGILVFVRTSVSFSTPFHASQYYRPVCCPSPLLHHLR
jgi:hypothetical protein